MEHNVLSDSNSWLTFTDNLNWSRNESALEEKTLRSMLCQQFLFVETSIIPDSWWLTNYQLMRVLNNSDLQQAIEQKYLIPARSNDFESTGLEGRFNHQLSLSEKDRMSGLILDDSHRRFLKMVDRSGDSITYNTSELGSFFSRMVSFIIKSPEVLRNYGLSHAQDKLQYLVLTKNDSGQHITASDLFKLFQDDKVMQRNVMSMTRPIYAINAPANYNFHMALAGDSKNKMYHDICSLFYGLSRSLEPHQFLSEKKLKKVVVPISVDHSLFQNTGMLSFDEISGAKEKHFKAFNKNYIDYCNSKIGNSALEDAFKSYQSNLLDYLTEKNAKFDICVANSLECAAKYFGYAKTGFGTVAAYEATANGFSNFERTVICSSVAVVSHAFQRVLDHLSSTKMESAMSKGKIKLLTRLDVWNGDISKT